MRKYKVVHFSRNFMPVTTVPAREIKKTTLPNGIRIVTEHMPHVRSVSVGIWVNSGSRCELPEENGLSHFLEHILFKGTVTRSAEQIARSVDSVGGNLDAFTSKELVSFNTKVLDQHLPLAFDIISDLVVNPLLSPEDIEKEKGVILEELKMEADNPEYLVHEIFSSNFWKDHPLGKPILGTKETIRRFHRNQIESYYHTSYVPANLVITAAGNLDHNQIVELTQARFDAIRANGARRAETTPATHARVCLRQKKSLHQLHLCIGVPCYPVSHDERFASYVLNTLLGGGMSSRLFQNIREKQGLAYSVFSELSPYRDTGCLSIYAGTSVESAPKVIELIMSEFRQFKEELVGEDELRRAKDYLKGSLMLGLESTSNRMANLARQELYFGRFFSLDELNQSIEEVTSESVQRAAANFFDSRQIALTALGNLDGLKLRRSHLIC